MAGGAGCAARRTLSSTFPLDKRQPHQFCQKAVHLSAYGRKSHQEMHMIHPLKHLSYDQQLSVSSIFAPEPLALYRVYLRSAEERIVHAGELAVQLALQLAGRLDRIR